MRVTRLYTFSDGESHFEDLEVPLRDLGPIGRHTIYKFGVLVPEPTSGTLLAAALLAWGFASRRARS